MSPRIARRLVVVALLIAALPGLLGIVGAGAAAGGGGLGIPDASASNGSSSAAGVVATPTAGPASNPCVGSVRAPANGTTVVSIQGEPHNGSGFRPRLVGVGPRGEIEWVYRPEPATWSYDVDPIGDGRLFGIATFREDGRSKTRLFVLDVPDREIVWRETLDIADTHDADVLDRHRILIANMRAFRNGTSHDRLAIYNRTRGEFTWSWYFRDHYPNSTDGGIDADEDWTHVNDVDRIGPGRYMASPKNFDQVVVVNRSTGGIEMRLGRDGRHRTLRRQHNPQFLRGEGDRATILVADSGNDRAVEYARATDGWERTWELHSPKWVRDADRLPDGNTLVTASRGNRVMEVAPDGTVVWEVYTPWLPYEAERMAYGDEPGGPTAAEMGAYGSVRLSGDTDPSTDRLEACGRYLRTIESNWTVAESERVVPRPGNESETAPGDGRSPSDDPGSPDESPSDPTVRADDGGASDDPGGDDGDSDGDDGRRFGAVPLRPSAIAVGAVLLAVAGAVLWRRAAG